MTEPETFAEEWGTRRPGGDVVTVWQDEAVARKQADHGARGTEVVCRLVSAWAVAQ